MSHRSPNHAETGVAPPAPTRLPGTEAAMLLIVNPRATTVSGRLKNLVVYALRGRYDVEAVETEGRNHATALTREAVGEGYDLVVAFGGDGTLNEAANGLAGRSVPLTILPGGCTTSSAGCWDPDRHRRRDRAPAGAGGRPPAAADRPRPRERPVLRLLRRRRPRRGHDPLGRRASAA